MYSFGERHYKTTRVYELIHDTHSTNKSGLWACFLDPGMLSSLLSSPSCHSEAPFPWRHCWSFHLPSQFEPKLGALPLRLPASPLHHCHSYTCIIDASCNILEGRTAPYSLHLCVPLKCLAQRRAPIGDAIHVYNSEWLSGDCNKPGAVLETTETYSSELTVAPWN